LAEFGEKLSRINDAVKTTLDLSNNKMSFKDLVALTNGDIDSPEKIQHTSLLTNEFSSPVALISGLLLESLKEITGDSEEEILKRNKIQYALKKLNSKVNLFKVDLQLKDLLKSGFSAEILDAASKLGEVPQNKKAFAPLEGVEKHGS
jgi:hypothetical protein